MKYRSSYVSNSSSCSFIIDKANLSDKQKEFVMSLGEYDWYSEQEGVVDIVCEDKSDSYELDVDSRNSGHDGYLAVSMALNSENIKYEVDWY